MTIKILSDAEDDLIDAFYFYERQQSALGNDFLQHLDDEILNIPSVCGIHSKHFGYYRALVRNKFPYAIYYKFEKDMIYIHAVFDCRKDPKDIAQRLKSN
jgi:hypothetical protein